MRVRVLTAVAALVFLCAAAATIRASSARPSPLQSGRTVAADPRAFLNTYCVTCHSTQLKTGGLALDAIDAAEPAANPAVWEEAARKVRTGLMPPPRARRPDAAAASAFVASLESALDRAGAEHPDPGRVPAVRRLNRTEFQNAVRDLLALDSLPKEIDISVLLPPDDFAEGFDNMADALYVSPTLIERYLGAARKISRVAVGDPSTPRMVDTYQLSGQ